MTDGSRKTIQAVFKCVDRLPYGAPVDWERHAIEEAYDFDSSRGCEGVLTGTIVRRGGGIGIGSAVEFSSLPNARVVHSVIWNVVGVDQQTNGTVQVKLDGTAAVDFILRSRDGGPGCTYVSASDLTLRVPEHTFDEQVLWADGGSVTGRIVKGIPMPKHLYGPIEWHCGRQPFVGITDNQDGTFTVELEGWQPY